jgi:hypothetical protein
MVTLRDASFLLDKLNIQYPPVGVYDAPVDSEFNPVVQILPQKRTCLFAYFNAWMRGQTLKITSCAFGCLGCGYWMFSKDTRDKKALANFLTLDEGLKCNLSVTNNWLDTAERYHPIHKTLFIGPLKGSMDSYLKSVTLFVNADQLSSLIIAANYGIDSGQEQPVKVPFGSGCSQLLVSVAYQNKPAAVIGGTDLSMRAYLPEHILSFTMNKTMYETLCQVGHGSFFEKSYFENFVAKRKGI